MKFNLVPILAAGALLLAAAPDALAQAPATTGAGVLAGEAVTNNVSVEYSVGGVVQTTPVTDSATFLVDRKVVLAVTETNSQATSVAPGALNAALRFDVTNDSNDFIDILLEASEPVSTTHPTFKGGDGSATELDTAQASATFTLYLDVNANGTYEAGTDTALPLDGGLPYLDGVAPGDTVAVLVVADEMPDDTVLAQDDVIVVQLVGTAHSAYADQRVPTAGEITARDTALETTGDPLLSGTLGTALASNNATADDDDAIDNVFADPADTTEATGDAAFTGTDTSYDAYKVATTTILVAKTYGVLSDGNTAAGHKPKPVPGATVLYCIKVTNSGTTDATDVTITDQIPAGTQYQTGTIMVVANATLDCAADPAAAVAAGGTPLSEADDTDAADYNVTTTGAVTSQVDVDGGEDTTTMFQVKIL